MRFELPVDPREARRVRFSRWASTAVVSVLLIVVADLAWVGFEGSRQAAEITAASGNCQTPDSAYGWEYEAINYPAAAEGRCPPAVSSAGSGLLAADGTPIAGWYIPRAKRPDPAGPTIVLAHDHGANKGDLLPWARLLHDGYNLVLFDFRGHGQSGAGRSTLGVLEKSDLRAVIDWVERVKRPKQLGVLGVSMGGAAALAEAAGDDRVAAVVLDSTHATLANALQARLEAAGHRIALPEAWAILLGGLLRTGTDMSAADPLQAIPAYGARPLLVVSGGRDGAIGPHDAQDLLEAAQRAGSHAALRVCATAGHDESISVCADDYAGWLRSFFHDAFAG